MSDEIQYFNNAGSEGEFYALDKTKWQELRKIKGIEKGKPYNVLNGGLIKISEKYSNMEVRIFVRRVIE